MSSMLARKAAVISAVERLAALDDCQSITITFRDSYGAYSVAAATLSSDASEMILKLSLVGPTTSVTLPLTPLSER